MAKKQARKAASRSARKRRTIKRTAKQKSATVTRRSLKQWLAGVRSMADSGESAGKPRGACLVPNPAGGPRVCISTDRDTCKLIKGTFVGGPC